MFRLHEPKGRFVNPQVCFDDPKFWFDQEHRAFGSYGRTFFFSTEPRNSVASFENAGICRLKWWFHEDSTCFWTQSRIKTKEAATTTTRINYTEPQTSQNWVNYQLYSSVWLFTYPHIWRSNGLPQRHKEDIVRDCSLMKYCPMLFHPNFFTGVTRNPPIQGATSFFSLFNFSTSRNAEGQGWYLCYLIFSRGLQVLQDNRIQTASENWKWMLVSLVKIGNIGFDSDLNTTFARCALSIYCTSAAVAQRGRGMPCVSAGVLF